MNNLIELNSNNLAKFLEDFVDSGVKLVDELDLFKDDDLFASVPYGKIVNYITKKIIQINDPNEALKKALGLSTAYNILIAIKKNKLILSINEDNFTAELKKVKKELANCNVNVNEFDLENFFQNSIVKLYIEKIDQIFSQYLNNIQKSKILQHRYDYLKLDFLKLIESNSLAYEKLNAVFRNKSHEDYLILYKKISYQLSLKNLFNDRVLNDEAGMTLADIYIEPYFKVHEYCLKKDVKNNEVGSNSFKKISNKSIHQFLYSAINNGQLDNNFFYKKNQICISF